MSNTATMMAQREDTARDCMAHAQQIEAFLKRLRAICNIADQASGVPERSAYLDREMEREFHYLVARDRELAQRPLITAMSNMASSIATPLFVGAMPKGDANAA